MRTLIAFLTWSIASFAMACSLCTNVTNQATLGEEMDNASVVVVGRLSNPRFAANPAAGVGAGTTDLAIEKILKTDVALQAGQSLALPRYLPVPADKAPQYVIFLERFRDRFDVLQGRAVQSPALLNYLDGARGERAKGRVPALVYYAKHLDHADESIALDAFIEFAKSKDADVAKAATQLDPTLVRRLLAKKELDRDRLSLFAFFLGCCGQDRDADELLRIAKGLTGERKNALDGVMAGYVALRPQDGWKRLAAVLSDPKEHFDTRLAAIRTARMLQGVKGLEVKPAALAVYRHVIRDGQLADLAVEDLRRWQWWDLTAEIAAQFGQPTHRAPIVQNCLIRYAVTCPLPEAKALVARARQVDAEQVEFQEKLHSQGQ